MPTYTAPGVYVEEVPSSFRPLEGAGTSTAAFIGVVSDDVEMPELPTGGTATVDPVGKVRELLTWGDFETHFGTFGEGNAALAHAVFGFFLNGGTRCYVVRIAAEGDLTNPADELALLETYEDVSIVAIPGAVTDVQHTALIAHCSKMRDRIAVLDGATPATLDTSNIKSVRPVDQSEAGAYAALYYPWISTVGPDPSGKRAAVPPSGHIAGVYARSDATRGVFKAPANEAILGALDVTTRVSQGQQAQLNPAGVNVIRPIAGALRIWGARTLSNGTEFQYVSTRRYVCYLRDTLTVGTAWAVFEPNGIPLWKSLIRNISNFLLAEWQSGALFGATPEKAFFVRCDETTNPPASRELGRVVIEIGVAIVRPAEFVIFRIQQTSGE